MNNNDRLVNFIICGVQKGGTSVLDIYLREHPEVCMAERKEVHFFDTEHLFNNIMPNYSQYHACFKPQSAHRLIGEATPIYMYWHDAPRRMWEYNSNMKLIVILRNPIDRAYSHWNMEKSRNSEDLSFWDAIQNEQQRCREALPHQHRVYSYIDRGFYLEQLRRLWFYFSKDNVLILKNEHLRNLPNETLKKVCGFLGVNNFENINAREVHSLRYSSNMSNTEKEYLRQIYKYEIKSIERVLSWDCSDWLA
ncbi:MAG: sulfotransferase domain-containing protein [Pseudomonadota bacterium]